MLPPHAYSEPATIRIDAEFLTIDVNLKTKWDGSRNSELSDLRRSDPAPDRRDKAATSAAWHGNRIRQGKREGNTVSLPNQRRTSAQTEVTQRPILVVRLCREFFSQTH